MKLDSLRVSYLMGFFLIAGLLGFAAYIEVFQGIHPCPLCELQRVMLVALGIIFLLGSVLKFKKMRNIFLSFISLLVASIGIIFSGRQVYLQQLPPDSMGECGISLTYLFKIFPFSDAMKQLWRGGTECSQRGWEFLHLSLAAWSLIAFVILFFFVILQLKRIKTE